MVTPWSLVTIVLPLWYVCVCVYIYSAVPIIYICIYIYTHTHTFVRTYIHTYPDEGLKDGTLKELTILLGREHLGRMKTRVIQAAKHPLRKLLGRRWMLLLMGNLSRRRIERRKPTGAVVAHVAHEVAVHVHVHVGVAGARLLLLLLRRRILPERLRRLLLWLRRLAIGLCVVGGRLKGGGLRGGDGDIARLLCLHVLQLKLLQLHLLHLLLHLHLLQQQLLLRAGLRRGRLLRQERHLLLD